MASNSKPEITTTSIETPSSPEELTTTTTSTTKEQDALNTNTVMKDCPQQKIQHRLSLR